MTSRNEDTLRGLLFAVSAYFLWGFLPLYMKWLAHIPPFEVVAHRVLWSVPIASLLLIVMGRTSDVMRALRTPRVLAMGCVTAALITINWSIYVWAIMQDRALDAALGYYINPLFSIALGAVLLRERLDKTQLSAVALAATAVAFLTWQAGSLPWVSVGLTVSWAFYAYFKKQLPIGPNQGFLLEVLILTPPALAYLTWLGPQNAFPAEPLLLMGCGLVTAIPLVLYANGAKGLKLSTIGILQYIAPTMIFLVAVFVFGEEFDAARKVAFPMIWAALVIYSIPMIKAMRKAR